MVTVNQVQNHISSLINQDKQDEKQINSYYEQALTIIKNSLTAFFNEYATDEGLDINTVSQQSNSWDMKQFEDAINVLLNDQNVNSDLNSRLMAARATANNKKIDTINSIIGAAVGIATYQTQNYGNKVLKQSYINEYNHLSKNSKMSLMNIPKDVKKQADFNNRVWIHGDNSVNRVKEVVNKVLKSGLTQDNLRKLNKPNDNKPKTNNIDTAAQTGISFNKQLTRMGSISNANQARLEVYKQDDNVQYVKWVTENDDKVCDDCAPLDGQVFALDDAPVPQIDTHLNCRCQLVACDADGNLL